MSVGLLLSGGMDSIALAYWLRPEFAFTVNYGQLAADTEIRTAEYIAGELGIKHVTIDVDCSSLGSGDLTGEAPNEHAPSQEWWPYRNQLLVTLAAMKGISLGVTELQIGSVASDESHVDGRSCFIESLNKLLFMQEGGLTLSAPAINLTTTELVQKSQIPMSLLSWAHSCHTGNYACGSCRGCNKHRIIMRELGNVSY